MHFLIPICLWLTEPEGSTRAPTVDSVVVSFRWVKSRPCFEREVHLISSLVSKEMQLVYSDWFCRKRRFLNDVFLNLVFLYNTLLISCRRYPEVELKKLIVLAFVCLLLTTRFGGPEHPS